MSANVYYIRADYRFGICRLSDNRRVYGGIFETYVAQQEETSVQIRVLKDWMLRRRGAVGWYVLKRLGQSK